MIIRRLLPLIFLLSLLSPSLNAQIPSSLFGMSDYIHRPRSVEPWPWVQFHQIRSWDTYTDWSRVNPQPGIWNWTNLDWLVNTAASHQTEVLYTFGKTPQWASSNPTLSTCSGMAGSCAPPSNLQYWDDYVMTVATRYKGKIRYYEVWNEPNLAEYWSGDKATLVLMAQHAYNIIKNIDPNAIVLSPPTTASAGGASYLDGYLAAGGGSYADVIAFHGYIRGAASVGYPVKAEDIVTTINAYKNVLAKYNQGSKPLWDTEASWGDSTINGFTDQQKQAAYVAKAYLLRWSSGVKRFYWYAWDTASWGTLCTVFNPSTNSCTNPYTPQAIAYNEIYKWMVGATLTAPCSMAADYTWSCHFTRPNGYEALAVWNSTVNVTYAADPKYTQMATLSGGKTAIPSSGLITVAYSPVLLETVANPPVASLRLSAQSGFAPLSVTADSSGSTDSNGTITTRTFDFGDGTVTSGSVTATHTYSTPGQYTVTLTVKDDTGLSSTAQSSVSVKSGVPTATFTVTPQTGTAPLPVTVDSSASTDPCGGIVSRAIDFGDGSVVSNVPIANHTYATAGSYTVKVTVVGSCNLSSSSTASVVVAAPPPAPVPPLSPMLVVSPESGRAVLYVTADSAGSTGSITSRTINFGDGTILSNVTRANHSYRSPGTYTVSLTIRDASGNTATATKTVLVYKRNGR